MTAKPTCPKCGSPVTVTERLLGGYAKARCLTDGEVIVQAAELTKPATSPLRREARS